MIYLVRYLFIFVVISFSLYFLFKTAMTTPYFKDKERRGRILRRVLYILLSIALTVFILNVYLFLEINK